MSIEEKLAELEIKVAKLEEEFSKPRKWSKKHCMSKDCAEMGFSEKASCRPYKNCYKK